MYSFGLYLCFISVFVAVISDHKSFSWFVDGKHDKGDLINNHNLPRRQLLELHEKSACLLGKSFLKSIEIVRDISLRLKRNEFLQKLYKRFRAIRKTVTKYMVEMKKRPFQTILELITLGKSHVTRRRRGGQFYRHVYVNRRPNWAYMSKLKALKKKESLKRELDFGKDAGVEVALDRKERLKRELDFGKDADVEVDSSWIRKEGFKQEQAVEQFEKELEASDANDWTHNVPRISEFRFDSNFKMRAKSEDLWWQEINRSPIRRREQEDDFSM